MVPFGFGSCCLVFSFEFWIAQYGFHLVCSFSHHFYSRSAPFFPLLHTFWLEINSVRMWNGFRHRIRHRTCNLCYRVGKRTQESYTKKSNKNKNKSHGFCYFLLIVCVEKVYSVFKISIQWISVLCCFWISLMRLQNEFTAWDGEHLKNKQTNKKYFHLNWMAQILFKVYNWIKAIEESEYNRRQSIQIKVHNPIVCVLLYFFYSWWFHKPNRYLYVAYFINVYMFINWNNICRQHWYQHLQAEYGSDL